MIPPLWRWKTCGKVYFGSMICNGPLSEAFCQAGNGVGHGGSTIAA